MGQGRACRSGVNRWSAPGFGHKRGVPEADAPPGHQFLTQNSAWEKSNLNKWDGGPWAYRPRGTGVYGGGGGGQGGGSSPRSHSKSTHSVSAHSGVTQREPSMLQYEIVSLSNDEGEGKIVWKGQRAGMSLGPVAVTEPGSAQGWWGVPNVGQNQSGYMTLAILEGPMWAKWLHNPCRFGDPPQKKGAAGGPTGFGTCATLAPP